ncbi:hypothetical protein FACS1894204_12400 [Synergistales bacterium]|nr:hypothetical protein FACS1894204_12400 [Synergistales bacterium]
MQNHFFHSDMPVVVDNEVCMDRQRIRDLLEKALQKTLVTVVAGAGYGKTEAVSSFLRRYNAVTVWVQLSKRDNLCSRFWESYIHTLSKRNTRLAARLSEMDFPESECQFDRYVTMPKDEMADNVKYVLVFDDFHLIEDSSVLRFMQRTVDALLPNMTMIIISRSEPAINTVRLLSKGVVAHIDEDSLRFTKDEIQGYFQTQNISPTPQTLSNICASTEGWAFAVTLAGISFKKTPTREVDAISAMKLNIFKLIESEIFSGISEELQNLLIKLSLVEYISPGVVKEFSSSAALKSEMDRLSSFIRYDSFMNVYRINYLFLEFLRQKQGVLAEDEKRRLYIKAAAWCVKNNYIMDAIRYSERACDYEKIAKSIYALPTVLPRKTALYLLEVIKRIPSDAYEKSDTLCLIYTRLLECLGRFDEALAELDVIIEKFEAMPRTRFTCRVLFGAYNNVGFAHYYNYLYAHDDEFWRYFQKSDEYFLLSKHTIEGPIRIFAVGACACRVGAPEKGHIEKFIEAVEKSIPYVSRTINGCMWGLDDLLKAETAYFKSDMKNCLRFAHAALYKAREKEQYEIENRALFFLLRVGIATGSYPKIQAVCKQLELQLENSEYAKRYNLYDIAMGWYYITIRQDGQAAQWLKNAFYEDDMDSPRRGQENMVSTKYCLVTKKYHELLVLLENQRDKYRAGAFLFGQIEQKALTAICQYHTKERQEAMKSLKAAYDLAYPNSLDMFFIEKGNDMRTLTGAAMKDASCGIPREWLKKIHVRASTYAKNLAWVISEYKKDNHLKNEPRLTDRELKILTDLSHGLSRTEIAANQDLSINTVSATLQMIYTKLGAGNVLDAIRIAMSLKLLE